MWCLLWRLALITHLCLSSARFAPPRHVSQQANLARLLKLNAQRRAVNIQMSKRTDALDRLDSLKHRILESERLQKIKAKANEPLQKIKTKVKVSIEGTVDGEGISVWNASTFHPDQNTVFLDVDDTILSSGNFVAGIDNADNQISRSIPETKITQKKCAYPRVLEFINMISGGVSQGTLQTPTGNLFVTSARPGNRYSTGVKAAFQDYLQTHEPDRLHRDPVGFLWGTKIGGTLFAMEATNAWARDKIRDKVNRKLHPIREPAERDPAKRQKLKSEFCKLGTYKYKRIKQQISEIEDHCPQYRQAQKLSFLGDNGQGDFYASIKLLEEGLVDFAFIHDVRNLKDVPKEDWIDRDPEAAGAELYRDMSSDLQQRIFLFRDYAEAIEIAASVFPQAR